MYAYTVVGPKNLKPRFFNSFAVTEASTLFAKDLKKRGFKFLGPTTVYAYMQACGMVNDHSNDCFRKEEVIGQYS